MRQPASQLTDHRAGEIDEPNGKAGLVHHLADEQEERDGEERKVVQSHPHPLRNDGERHVPLHPDHECGRDEHGERDRDAKQAQSEKQREQKDEHENG